MNVFAEATGTVFGWRVWQSRAGWSWLAHVSAVEGGGVVEGWEPTEDAAINAAHVAMDGLREPCV